MVGIVKRGEGASRVSIEAMKLHFDLIIEGTFEDEVLL
jgi:hypothetical protein